jgi:hypothetical protein
MLMLPQPLIARVKNGRLVLDEPTDLPEGEEVHLVPMDDEHDDGLDERERAELHRSLEIAAAEADAGELIDEDVVMAELDAKRV